MTFGYWISLLVFYVKLIFHFCDLVLAKVKGFAAWPATTKKQPNSIDCGYYVMKNMLDIVSANITGSWTEVFNDPKELSSDELYELRKIWATYFLELYKGARVSSRCKFNNGLEFHLAI
ncbi:hypothetical protein QL285_057443 [Trifolium repens]|nr:hypothetical protein QL285_057443 [Trifolium repens]